MIDEDDEPRYYGRGERWDRSVLLGIVLFCFFPQKSDFSAVEVLYQQWQCQKKMDAIFFTSLTRSQKAPTQLLGAVSQDMVSRLR